tara:strand:+ start:210 stop:485 length:276 start_codon:yes stop_codon:yes gene_type:complete
MKLFLVHTGFYDNNISNGFYEMHTNYFIVAENEKSAKKRVSTLSEYKEKKMHIDGILEINNVGNYNIRLEMINEHSLKSNNQFSYSDVKKI